VFDRSENCIAGTRMIAVLAAAPAAFRILVACGSEPASSPETDALVRGEAIYDQHCAECHGSDGEGAANWQRQNADNTYPAPPHDSTGHTWHHSNGYLFRTIQGEGGAFDFTGFKSAMPSFGDRLDPQDIRTVIDHLKSMWGSTELAAQSRASGKTRSRPMSSRLPRPTANSDYVQR